MSKIELPASTQAVVSAQWKEHNQYYAKAQISARTAMENLLECGRILKKLKAIYVPQSWLRACKEELPYSARWASTLMKAATDYDAHQGKKQQHLLESAKSFKALIRVLDSNRETGSEAGSDPTQEIPPNDPENADLDDNDAQSEGHISQPDLNVEPPEPPEPDPWQEVKQEVRDVYARVNAALKQLKEAVQEARGYSVFEFVGAIEQDMNNIKQTLAAAKPNQVCEKCRPATPAQAKSCRVCFATGMVPKCVNERQRT